MPAETTSPRHRLRRLPTPFRQAENAGEARARTTSSRFGGHVTTDLETRYLDDWTDSLDVAVDRVSDAASEGRPLSVGLLAVKYND